MIDVKRKRKMGVQDNSKDLRTMAEFERGVANLDVEGGVRLARPIRHEKSNTGL